MCQAGLRYDRLPGEWYGPSAAACVLRDLAAVQEEAGGLSLSSFGATAAGESPAPLRVHVAQGGTVYTSEVNRLACAVSSSSSSHGSGTNGNGSNTSDSDHRSNGQQQRQQQQSQTDGATAAVASVDPLSDPLRCPPKQPPPWQCSVLLLVPLRLGLDGLIRYYFYHISDAESTHYIERAA
jgi:Peptidase family C54